jgi:hypothetical protein
MVAFCVFLCGPWPHLKIKYVYKLHNNLGDLFVPLIVIFILMAYEQVHSHGYSPWKERLDTPVLSVILWIPSTTE